MLRKLARASFSRREGCEWLEAFAMRVLLLSFAENALVAGSVAEDVL